MAPSTIPSMWVNREGTDDELAIGTHEDGLYEIMLDLCPPGGVFMDVGAHVGRYTIRLALEGRTVIAVEGNPSTVETLLENVGRFGVQDRVRVIQAIAWDHPANLTMVEPYPESGSTFFLTDPMGVWVGTPLDRLDIQRMAPVSLVKIDVEGAEARCLRGMLKLLRRDRPRLIIELHEVIQPGIRGEVEGLLDELGYRHRTGFSYEGSDYLQGMP